MANAASLFARLKNRNFLRKTAKIIQLIEKFEVSYADFGEDDFRKKTLELRRRVLSGENIRKIIPESFALVRSAARMLLGRQISVCGQDFKWDMVHYRVQLQAGIALSHNMVGEIATGEGKTLIATLPLYLYSLFGKGCHIATVNEYLARRDCEWMRPLYSLLGLTCACVYSGQRPSEKRAAYAADITYGTASEFGFDYLRDNSVTASPGEKVQRGFFFCLVDEADSILADEARTPLIISGADTAGGENPYGGVLKGVRNLVSAQNRLCGALAAEVFEKLGKKGEPEVSDIEKLIQVRAGAPRNKILKRILKMGVANVALEKMQTGLATNFGECARHKLIEKLYYCVDEKTNTVSLTRKGREFLNPGNPDAFTFPDTESELLAVETAADISGPEKLRRKSEISAKALETAGRLRAVSQLLRAFSLYERDVDYIVRGGRVEIIDPNTGRVMPGRRWSDGLHQAVEAKEGLEIEAENATYATISIQNYFRMYSRLSGMTGTATELSDEFLQTYKMGVMEIPPNRPCRRRDEPDLIFLTRAEKYARIVEMAKSLSVSGRPVLIGTGSVEESETLSRMLKMRGIRHNLLNAKNDAHEAALVAQAGGRGMVTVATNMAGRGTDIKLAEGVNELGGLFIISSEHNYSRRIDRQLMGRCARQGDNGQTQFVVSLEDEFLRRHADVSPFQNAIKSKHKAGVPFSHPLFGRIIRRTQDKLEGDYSAERKNLLKFDNPANRQRGVAYALRDEILSASIDAVYSSAAREIAEYCIKTALPSEDCEVSEGHISQLEDELGRFFGRRNWLLRFEEGRRGEIVERIEDGIMESFKQVFGAAGAENGERAKRMAALSAFDRAWRDHIARLEELREAVYLRGYAQKDPYCEFEKEAFESFRDFFRGFREALFGGLSGFSVSGISPGAAVKSGYRAITA